MSFNVIYLHGFASGPESYKGQFFQSKFNLDFNTNLKIPDLNVPDFEHLSIQSQIDVVSDYLEDDSDNILIGASFGAFLAILIHSHAKLNVSKLFLIAPAMNMISGMLSHMSDNQIKTWEKNGSYPFMHHFYKTEKNLKYDFIETNLNFEKSAYHIDIETHIFHGKNDDVIPHQRTLSFFENVPHCDIHLYDSDHQMHDCLEEIWKTIKNALA
jgi:predicted esterase YcpF (UPF0227 family)